MCACNRAAVQVDADDLSTISTVVDISDGELYVDYEEVRATLQEEWSGVRYVRKGLLGLALSGSFAFGGCFFIPPVSVSRHALDR